MYEFGSKEREMERQLATILFWAKDHEEPDSTGPCVLCLIEAQAEGRIAPISGPSEVDEFSYTGTWKR